MTEDITSLQIRILYDKVEAAEKRLQTLTTTGNKTKASIAGLGKQVTSGLGSLYAFATGAAVVTAAIAGMRAVISKTAEFQKLKAGLITATGSIQNANTAFEALQDYAQTTPSSLIGVTEAFTKLVNYGLTPSERALTSYGNTASAMGKSLNQMVESVADATTGEFERLKEFGIKAKTEGDNITFRFRGVSTTVKNSAAEIEKYLIELGEKNFAGAMEEQMKTLNGQFSAIGDEWDKLLNNIGERGLGDAVASGLNWAIELLGEFNNMLASGEIQKHLDAQAIGWQALGETISNIFTEATDGLEDMVNESSGDSDTWASYWNDVFLNFPINLNAGLQMAHAHLKWFVEAAAGLAGNLNNSLDHFGDFINSSIVDIAGNDEVKARWQEIQSRKVKERAEAEGYSPLGGGPPREETATDRLNATMDEITANTDKLKGQAAERRHQAGLLRQIDDELRNLEKGGPKKDRLAGFGVGVDTGGNGKTKPKGGGGGGGKGGSKTSEFETLEKNLRDQETLISESYERRFALIEANTRQGSAYQAELELSLTEKFEEEQQRRLDKMKKEPETMFQAYADEERMIEESYERRKEIILEATELTESEKLKMLNEAELQYTSSMRKHEIERNKMAMGLASDFFGNIAAIAGAFGKKGAKIAKAAAIAQTTIKTYESATSAYASLAGIPYIGPALGAVAAGAAIAAGFANVQRIRSADEGNAGSYAMGGIVPGASVAGDNLVANVNSGEMILNAAQQRNLFNMANSGGQGAAKPVVVNIANYAGAEVTATQRETPESTMIDLVVKKVESRINRGVAEGSSPIAGTLEKAYGLRRGA